MEDINKAAEDGGEGHDNESPAPESSTSPTPVPVGATRSTTPPANRATASRVPSSSSEPVPGIRRYPTMPSQQRARFAPPTPESSRPRGRSLSTREQAELAHLPSHERQSKDDEDRMMPIPESRAVSPKAESTTFVSPGMRRRATTFRTQGSVRRRGTVTARPVMNTGLASGVAADAQSMNFSLAGSPGVQEVVAATVNQPYVDPGYTQLNPAYDQPVNTRPVWGLAGPLPRVLRPGMVPTRSELKIDTGVSDNNQGGQDEVDLEQGRIEPTLRLGKITSQLQETRRKRENSLLQAYDGSSPTNASLGLGRSASTRITPFPDLTEGEENLIPQDSHSSIQGGDQAQPEANQWYPDDAGSATTEHENGDEGEWHEEIVMPSYEEDEIHNLHTHWSVIRLQFREPLAELLAVTCQLTIGFCANLAVTTSSNTAGDSTSTCWAWGLATMIGVYIAGGISGAHLNPSISIMLWIYRGFPLRRVPMYLLAQILGAFIAALIAFGIYQKDILTFAGSGVSLMDSGTLGSFITYPRNAWVDGSTAFFNEFVGTAILAIAVLALGDDTNAPPGAGMSAFIIGLVIVVLSMAFGYNTGAALNPSRDLGPRLAVLALGYGGDVFRNAYWVYGPWLATISGAILGGFLYDAAIFVGGESPVNYPRRRMKRAGTKWKRKWSGRIKRKYRKVRGGGERGDGEKIVQ
ncbi:MIP family channel protein [Phlyctema vagabunda]|uniref:MIP family channel protein n=1 Tax=Phlyctema vagabunda TaxID=108571 RepID=A0ABR4PUD1_9HELO